jgi:RNase P/RNase MRP subunit p30
LEPKNANDLLNSLRRNRWNTEVIVVNCRNKPIARQAGKDRRVDLITYPIIEDWNRNYLDRHQANLMKVAGSGYLIDLSKLFVDDPQTLKKRINFLKENTKNALKRDIPVVASSFAENAIRLRDPLGLAALLTLLDIEEEGALDMISTEPYRIIENNRTKLKDSYIAQGVWVIKDE